MHWTALPLYAALIAMIACPYNAYALNPAAANNAANGANTAAGEGTAIYGTPPDTPGADLNPENNNTLPGGGANAGANSGMTSPTDSTTTSTLYGDGNNGTNANAAGGK